MARESKKDKAWDLAKKVRGKDPDKYRKDPYGSLMYHGSYGKNTDMGWELDHIKPTSRGGSSATRNLQALNVSVNRGKGDDMRKRSRHSTTNK